MISTSGRRTVATFKIIKVRCEKCGRPMFEKPCSPCWTDKGWATCAKCVRCGHIIGLRKAGRR